MAAVEAYRQEIAPVLVLTGGKTRGEENSSESQITWEFLDRKYQQEAGKFSQVPQEAIYLEEESKDTSANFKNVLQLIQENGWRQVAVLTNDFHLERAIRLAHNFGLEAVELSAENLLRSRDRRFAEIIERCYRSEKTQSLQRKEVALRAMLIVDPKAIIPAFIASRNRHGL